MNDIHTVNNKPTVFKDVVFNPWRPFKHNGVTIYANHVSIDVSAVLWRNRLDDITGFINFLDEKDEMVAQIEVLEHTKIIKDIFGINLEEALYEDTR